MAFLYNIISDYSKQTDTLTDDGSSGNITTFKGYLDSIDEVIFDVITTATCEILTMNSIDNVDDEYLHYLSYLLGYEWNFNLDNTLQRNILKNILQIYKRKGTKFAFHFNLYQLDPTVSIYEPYQDLFILDKSKLNIDHLPSHDYYSYGILVIRLNKYIPDILEILEYIRPAGWKIILEFNYIEYYSFHIKPDTDDRTILISGYLPIDYRYSKYDILKESYQNTLDTEGNVYSDVIAVVTRGAGNSDYLPSFFRSEFIVNINRIYINNSNIFELDIDYVISNNNQIITWTDIGQSKINENDNYYIDYTKDDKLAAEYYYAIDDNIQNLLQADVTKDKYYYNEFNNILDIPKMSDSNYDIQFINAIQYSAGQFMPISMLGHTFMVGLYQPAYFKVNNETERYNLSNLIYWEPKKLSPYRYINNNTFSLSHDASVEYGIGKKIRFNENIFATILTSLYNKISGITTITVVFDNIEHQIPLDLTTLCILKTWLSNNDIVYQIDTNEYYIVIDNNKLNNNEGYQLSSLDLIHIYNNLNYKPNPTASFTSTDLANHHLLYETDESELTFYRNNVHYSDYSLLNGEIFVEGGTTIFTVPNGINEVCITTCGGGGGSSSIYQILNNVLISVGGGGGAVITDYMLEVIPGDIIFLTAGTGGAKEIDGTPSFVEIKKINSTTGLNIKILQTVANGGKAPKKINQLNISDIGINGIGWYGGEAGGYNGGAGGAIWTKNTNIINLLNSTTNDFIYSDYGNSGLNLGGKSIIENGLICGGGGSFGLGAGKDSTAGYGGGGCALINNGTGGNGFIRLTYDINKVID